MGFGSLKDPSTARNRSVYLDDPHWEMAQDGAERCHQSVSAFIRESIALRYTDGPTGW